MKVFSLKNILLLLTLVACETSAQTLLNSSIPGKGHYIKFLSENQSLIMGMIFYAIVGFVYSRVLYSLRKNSKSLNVANSLWNAGIQISIAIIGVLFFKEKMTLKNWIGNGLMTIGLLMVV
jgi:multidrug transporter EmrE-like cation transporter